MSTAVEVRDAFRIYDTESTATAALQGLDLAVEEGEIVVVLGPSGSGKTTLLRVLAGLERLSAGSVRVLGTDVGRLDAGAAAAFRATELGILDQHYARSLSPDLSCGHTVGLHLELAGHSPREARRAAQPLLEEVGLADRAGERPQRLSGGEQQRVAVCAAVAHRPRLLLADEPAGELDADNARIVYDLLGGIVRSAGATAVIVSHDTQAASIADRLVSIRDGRIVEEARPGSTPLLVISRKGWARLPHAGDEPRHAEVSERDGRIVVTPQASGPVRGEPSGDRAGAHGDGRGRPGPVVAELDQVSRHFETPSGRRVVLDRVSHRFEAGTLTGVIGRSGSGKTTLLHLLAGLDHPSAGSVTVAGERLAAKTRTELADLRREHIALVTQEPGLIPYLSALENVELHLELRGRRDGASGARGALDQVGLGERVHHRAADLSAGERERVAIARALASTPDILLVDEPTARLDEENAHRIGALLAEVAHRAGLAVVCATHDPALTETMDGTLELSPR